MHPRPRDPARSALRLVGRDAGAERDPRRAERAWIALFGTLAASAGHGVFLVVALTRLERLPGSSELGGPLARAALAWFALAAPLALASLALRGAFVRLAPRTAWALALGTAGTGAAAFALYLGAVALA